MKAFFSKPITYIVNMFETQIAVGIAFALWAIPLHLLFKLEIAADDYEIIKQFIEWFGVPYGLIMALVLVNVWTQFETTDRAFDREADAVLMFYNTFGLISNKGLKDNVNTMLSGYVNHVNNHYFDEYDNKTYKHEGDDILNNIRENSGRVIKIERYKELGIELLKLINELIDDRGDRLSYSKQRMPGPVRILSIIASFLWLAPFFFLNFEETWLGIFFLVCVTLVVVSILLIIIDLDDPIGGTWKVNLESWTDLTEIIKT